MYKDIDITQALNKILEIPIIDLRSPGEYGEATIPGAYNIPLLDNIERSLVGKVYKNEGSQKARELAMEIVAPRLPHFIDSFIKIAPKKKVVIFCWRGGERSHFAGCVLDAMGFKVYRILGGYKTHRRYVVQYLDRNILPLRAVVLHGLTGVGKTDLLLKLKERGYPVLDLEGLAKHRGSVFGNIGQLPTPSQKMFESLIERELRLASHYGFFVVECESRRLGNLYVPKSILNNMQKGYGLLLYAPVQTRIERILRDYAIGGTENITALQGAVSRLTKYLGVRKVTELNECLELGDVSAVIKYLLLQYYDPLYKYPDVSSTAYDLSVNTENMMDSVNKIDYFLNNLPEYNMQGR